MARMSLREWQRWGQVLQSHICRNARRDPISFSERIFAQAGQLGIAEVYQEHGID